MAKIVAFYYSQTGQGLEILQSVCKPLAEAGHEVLYKEVKPEVPFPFPWTSDAFFEAFPESRQGISGPVIVPGLADAADAGLVLVVYPTWFLSPSIPAHGFFQDERIRRYLKGKPVVTICGCRNMWIMAQNKVREYLAICGSRWVGNIVLQDRHHNLVSVITIIRWLIGGRKARKGIFPAAGVAQKDINHAAVFGTVIVQAIAGEGLSGMQQKLMAEKAIHYKPNIAFVEKVGHRIFGVWSKYILSKCPYGSPQRAFRLKLFKYYLFTVLFAISPIGLLLFYLTYPLRLQGIKKDKARQTAVED